MGSARLKLALRDETNLPAACYDPCNNAYLETQKAANSPALCESNSDFKRYYDECKQCLDKNNPAATTTGETQYLDAKFSSFVDFCKLSAAGVTHSHTSTTAYDQIPTTGFFSVSYFTTITTVGWMTTTLADNEISSASFTVMIPLQNLPVQSVDTASTSTTVSSSQPTNTSPAPTNNTAPDLPTPTIIGISMAPAVVIAVFAAVAGIYIRRRLRRQKGSPDSRNDHETKAQLHGDSLTPPLPPHEMDSSSPHGLVEMEGDKRACFELDSSMVHAELEAGEFVGSIREN